MIPVGPDIWLVAGGDHRLGSRFDCSVYAAKTPSGLVVFDTGSGLAQENLAGAFAELGDGPATIFLTHAHADHSGGLSVLRERYKPVVSAGSMTARIVTSGDEAAMSLDRARVAGIYPSDFRVSPCPVDRVIETGERIDFGDLSVTVIATPGHSADHLSYRVERTGWSALIAGDALFDGGRVTMQDTWDCSVTDTCKTIRTLAGLDFEAFLPGHGPITKTDGRRHVQVALSRVNRLLIPELFV